MSEWGHSLKVSPQFVSWKSRVIGFGHAEQDIGDADRAEYR
jgi:hypothetical protein